MGPLVATRRRVPLAAYRHPCWARHRRCYASTAHASTAHSPYQDKVLDVASFLKFLQDRIKVNGKAGNLGDQVSISSDKTKVTVTAEAPFSKR